MNDRLPCYSYGISFCKPASNGMWCSLLEKAYAKAYINY